MLCNSAATSNNVITADFAELPHDTKQYACLHRAGLQLIWGLGGPGEKPWLGSASPPGLQRAGCLDRGVETKTPLQGLQRLGEGLLLPH